MARRRDSIVLMIPWWGFLLVGLIAAAAIIQIPRWHLGNTPHAPFAGIFPPLVYLVLALCVATALVNGWRSFRLARRFNELRGLDHVRRLSWKQFEMIVGEAFRRQGYTVVETGRGGPDDGIDLVLHKDSRKYFVLCKHWKAWSVGVRPIRELAGVIGTRRAAGGFVVSSGSYSPEATKFARDSGIELIDGPALEEMVIAAQAPEPYLESTARMRLHTQSFFIPQETVPACPACDAPMVKRTGKRGAHAGREFWGCSKYPACKGMREA